MQGAAMPNGFWGARQPAGEQRPLGDTLRALPEGPRYRRALALGLIALIEDNQVHGNGYRGSSPGGVSMDDAQNATFRNNFFGPRTISRVSYRCEHQLGAP